MANITRRALLRAASTGAAVVGTGLNATLTGGRLFAQSAAAESAQPVLYRRSFSFLHSYEATGRYWRGLEKAGLLRPSVGVRLVNSPWGEDWRRFNEVARIGGPLHRIIQQRKCPLIVDRVVGGSPYNPYRFDAELIRHYAALLGPKLLGGQVHETVCNVHNDWRRFTTADKKFAKEPINPQELRGYFTWADAQRYLEYGTLDDYAGRVHFHSPESLWKEIEWAGKRQASRFDSRFSYCEGSHYGKFAWHIFYEYGAAYCLAEVGPWASTQSQFVIASLRGAAKAAGKPGGVFFAPWGPDGCTCLIPLKDASWQVSEKCLRDSGFPAGPQLGPSSALQRRIFFHAYLSGAHTLHEEWGAEGNLLDWDQGTLSSYGKVTQDLLDFQDAHPDVGQPYTPIALVADAAVPPPDEAPWSTIWARLFAYAGVDKSNAARKGGGSREAACYPPCALAELFDVVPSDAPQELWNSYREIIPVGRAKTASGGKASSPEEVYDRLAAAVRQWSPFARSTHLPMQINRRKSDGAWIVALYNPWGACRGDVGNTGSVLDEGCAIQDVLRPKSNVKSARVLSSWPSSSHASLQGKDIDVTVGPGGTLILEIME